MPDAATVRPRAAPAASRSQQLGLLGERVAARWLASRGWTVAARRFRSGHRDLDLVVRREDVVAFVEVKARMDTRFGDPVEAVDWRKRRELVRSAHVWIGRHGRSGETYRFDVVGVLIEPRARGPAEGARGGSAERERAPPRVRVRHVADAFGLPSAG